MTNPNQINPLQISIKTRNFSITNQNEMKISKKGDIAK
jgi:hypothetical protein